ncbi:MAG: JAB domain-containing protein [Bacteroidetes bacterium]|nr:MAG: JAB domain-containing protein [Bacteroidota bacterium]
MRKEKDNIDKTVQEITYKSIRNWKEDERPRERLIRHGGASLSDSELLAILISSGTKGFSALDASRKLLNKYSSITNLVSCDLSELKKTKGVGSAKAVKLAAAFEIARRIKAEPFSQKKIFRTPEEVAYYYIPKFHGERVETFFILLLNSANQIFREEVVAKGTLNSSIVHPREVFRFAITESAAGIILIHNHPSGNSEPSKEDLLITKQLVEAGKIIDIKVLDHIIIAGESFTSFAQKGLI